MKISTITVTGADDSVSPSHLLALSKAYPVVEFGILLSRKSLGSRRFPSPDWLREFSELPETVRCSGHICGSWVREIYRGVWPVRELAELLGPSFFERFSRWQLNTHGMRHEWNEEFIESLSAGPRGVIFQFDGKNTSVLEAAKASNNTNIAALFDLSHGAGTLPDEWPPLLDGIRCGYAGGLSPENVSEECKKIAVAVGDAEIWIDAETHLRSDNDRVFDMKKCERFIQNALSA